VEARAVCGGCDDRKERYVRKTDANKKAPAITTLGGRIVYYDIVDRDSRKRQNEAGSARGCRGQEIKRIRRSEWC
jgi:hypothetical protein